MAAPHDPQNIWEQTIAEIAARLVAGERLAFVSSSLALKLQRVRAVLAGVGMTRVADIYEYVWDDFSGQSAFWLLGAEAIQRHLGERALVVYVTDVLEQVEETLLALAQMISPEVYQAIDRALIEHPDTLDAALSALDAALGDRPLLVSGLWMLQVTLKHPAAELVEPHRASLLRWFERRACLILGAAEGMDGAEWTVLQEPSKGLFEAELDVHRLAALVGEPPPTAFLNVPSHPGLDEAGLRRFARYRGARWLGFDWLTPEHWWSGSFDGRSDFLCTGRQRAYFDAHVAQALEGTRQTTRLETPLGTLVFTEPVEVSFKAGTEAGRWSLEVAGLTVEVAKRSAWIAWKLSLQRLHAEIGRLITSPAHLLTVAERRRRGPLRERVERVASGLVPAWSGSTPCFGALRRSANTWYFIDDDPDEDCHQPWLFELPADLVPDGAAPGMRCLAHVRADAEGEPIGPVERVELLEPWAQEGARWWEAQREAALKKR